MPYDHWMTDPKVAGLAESVMGSIDFDPASNDVAQHYIRATNYCVAPDCDIVAANGLPSGNRLVNGLAHNWNGSVWCNPPYSAGNIDAFVDYAIDQWYAGRVTQMMFLVNSATDTKWYHTLLGEADALCLWKGRIKFWKIFDGMAHEKWEGEKSKQEGKGKIGNSPRFLNSLFYFSDSTEDLQCFNVQFLKHGHVIIL